MDKSLLDYLVAHPLFKNLEPAEIECLSPFITEEEIAGSTYVFLESEKATHFYVLRKGSLRASIGGKLIANIRPGDFFGEIAVLNDSIRTGSVFALEDSRVVAVNGREIFNGRSIPVEIAFKVLKMLIKNITSLYYTNDFFKQTYELIRLGEGEKVEFKSSLRYNIHTGKFGKEIEHAALKTIAAFLNSWGGILLVGVDDRQNIIGLGNDQFENDDRAMLHLSNMIKERLGTHFMQFVNCAIEPFESGKVMRIDVSPSNLPAYLSFNNEEYFYVRTGPSTTDLKPSRIFDYIENRFYRPRA